MHTYILKICVCMYAVRMYLVARGGEGGDRVR